jgi:hypothetical protein
MTDENPILGPTVEALSFPGTRPHVTYRLIRTKWPEIIRAREVARLGNKAAAKLVGIRTGTAFGRIYKLLKREGTRITAGDWRGVEAEIYALFLPVYDTEPAFIELIQTLDPSRAEQLKVKKTAIRPVDATLGHPILMEDASSTPSAPEIAPAVPAMPAPQAPSAPEAEPKARIPRALLGRDPSENPRQPQIKP